MNFYNEFEVEKKSVLLVISERDESLRKVEVFSE